MRPTTRVLLPVVQVSIATVLVASNYHRPALVGSARSYAPDLQFCMALNAPVAGVLYFVNEAAEKVVYFLWQLSNSASLFTVRIDILLRTVVFLPLVWLLWHIVAIELSGHGLSVLTPRTRFRRSADLLALVWGARVAWLGSTIVRSESVYWILVSMPYFLWAALIVSFYGHDLWASVRVGTRRHTH